MNQAMTCAETKPLLDAYFDAELDLASSLTVERHLAECPACSSTMRDLELLRGELTPDVFNLAAGVDLRPLKRRLAGPASWSESAKPTLLAAIAAIVLLAIAVPLRLRNPVLDPSREIVDSHVRSLMADHLVDVPSSDRHTVKPWFQGKLDFAPDVPDFAEQGFALVGGRLDVIAGQPAAALVYKRGGHLINVWISRTSAGDESPASTAVDGYQVVRWNISGLQHWVVSDLNRPELETLAGLLRGN